NIDRHQVILHRLRQPKHSLLTLISHKPNPTYSNPTPYELHLPAHVTTKIRTYEERFLARNVILNLI
ncbi:MAG TPA: hypothetical protein QF694_01450, partial [Dehalococcoidia bacterium]|nr:hypothetical protein [Dehalococcoidia bacterium]